MEKAFKYNIFFVRFTKNEIENIDLKPIVISKIKFEPGLWFTEIKSVKSRKLYFDFPVCYQGRYKTSDDDLLLISPFKLRAGTWVEAYYNIGNRQLLVRTDYNQGFDVIPQSIIKSKECFLNYHCPDRVEQLKFVI